MKTIMKKIISLILIEALFISSCKNDPNPVCKINATSVSGSYRIAAATYQANPTSPEENYYDIFFPDTCLKDNVYTFQTDATYLFKDSGTICSPPGDRNGTWSINGNYMVVDGDSTGIESFDCKTLVVFSRDVRTKGDKLKLTAVKQ
jgi:hypothetical protein